MRLPNTIFLHAIYSVGFFVFMFVGCTTDNTQQSTVNDSQLNIVLIFLDDADIQLFAETRYPTPYIVRLPGEGRNFFKKT